MTDREKFFIESKRFFQGSMLTKYYNKTQWFDALDELIRTEVEKKQNGDK